VLRLPADDPAEIQRVALRDKWAHTAFNLLEGKRRARLRPATSSRQTKDRGVRTVKDYQRRDLTPQIGEALAMCRHYCARGEWTNLLREIPISAALAHYYITRWERSREEEQTNDDS
jgi:hypothetical protein